VEAGGRGGGLAGAWAAASAVEAVGAKATKKKFISFSPVRLKSKLKLRKRKREKKKKRFT